MNDLDLRDLVLEELEFKPDINAASIGVTVQDGVVTLSGHVNSYAQKVSAERTVKAMKGVRGLAEEIEVRLNKLEGTADDTIASRALNIIAWSSDANVEGIKVTVQKGTVTLEGQARLAIPEGSDRTGGLAPVGRGRRAQPHHPQSPGRRGRYQAPHRRRTQAQRRDPGRRHPRHGQR